MESVRDTSTLGRGQGNSRGRATRELLICTAERLFAERGLNAVSMREIASAAGQRNNTTVDYHFGSRDELISAIYVFRATRVNDRCSELLDEFEPSGPTSDIAYLLRAQLVPHVESLRDPGNHFVRFLARAYTESTRLSVTLPPSTRVLLDSVVRAQTLLRECLPELDDRRFEQRIANVASWSIHSLAEYARDHPDANEAELGSMLDGLIVMLTGSLTA